MPRGVADVGRPRVLVVPAHIDPTVDLNDTSFVLSDPVTVTAWLLDGRPSTRARAAP